MAKLIECEDGFVVRGEDDDALVANAERHIAEAHPDLVGKLSRDEILAMAKDELLSMAEEPDSNWQRTKVTRGARRTTAAT